MADTTTIPNLPAAISLTGSELVWINYGAVDYRCTTGQIASLAGGGGLVGSLVSASGVSMLPAHLYTVRTSVGAFSGTLPPLFSVTPGAYLEVQDGDFNAAAHNFIINAYSGDTINAYATTGLTSYTMAVSDAIIRFTSLGTVWRARYVS